VLIFYVYKIKYNKNDAPNTEFCSQLLRREGALTKRGLSEKLLVVCLYFEVTELMASSLFVVFFVIIL